VNGTIRSTHFLPVLDNTRENVPHLVLGQIDLRDAAVLVDEAQLLPRDGDLALADAGECVTRA